MRKLLPLSVAGLLLAAGLFWTTLDSDLRGVLAHVPTNRDVLFWSVDQRDAAFRAMDRLPFLVKSRRISSGGKVYPLPTGKLLDVGMDVDAYMGQQRTAGLLIVHKGQVRLEKYGLGFGPGKRWTSFSVAKSLTSTLAGAAIADGYIKSITDMVSSYVPDLKGSVYDNVTIQQLLTMTSGVAWNEDYGDPRSDVAQFNEHLAPSGLDVTVSYMRGLKREAPPGTKWLYKTGETNLIGVVVSSATGKNLADYASEKIWQPFGMEHDASWLLGPTGHEISGCCVQATARDFARIGMFVLADGVANGQAVLPPGWFAEATTTQAITDRSEYGYGYQWWTWPDGSVLARGIFGQGIFIDRKRQLVIASNSNWPQATDGQGGDHDQQRSAFYRQVQQAIDREVQ